MTLIKTKNPLWVAVVCALWLAFPALAETGVDAKTIRIGQSAVQSGPLAENGLYFTTGVKLYFEQVNAIGGLFGRELELVTLDDAGDTKRTVQNTQKLLDEEKVFALIGYTGTGPVMAALPLIEKARIPLIGPYTGAEALRAPNRWLFHVRASYSDELTKLVQQLVTVGNKNIAVVSTDDNFGKADMKSAEEALAKYKLQPVAQATLDSTKLDAKKAVETISKAKPGAIILAMDSPASVAFIKEYLRQFPYEKPQFFGLSVISPAYLRKELDQNSAGITIAQVVPSPWSGKYGVVRAYRDALAQTFGVVKKYRESQAKASQQEPHHAALEGWIAAKVLVAGMQRAGKDLTREKLVTSLEGMRDFDTGGYHVEFTSGKHVGSSYVDLSIIRTNGQLAQ